MENKEFKVPVCNNKYAEYVDNVRKLAQYIHSGKLSTYEKRLAQQVSLVVNLLMDFDEKKSSGRDFVNAVKKTNISQVKMNDFADTLFNLKDTLTDMNSGMETYHLIDENFRLRQLFFQLHHSFSGMERSNGNSSRMMEYYEDNVKEYLDKNYDYFTNRNEDHQIKLKGELK